MIRVLLCSEGKTDQGYEAYHDGEYTHCAGVMQIFLQKLAHDQKLCFVTKKRRDIEEFRVYTRKYEAKEHYIGRKLAAIARQEECKYIAYHRDEDNKGFDNIYNTVHSYFTVAKEGEISCLAIVPMHMTESWLLSDADAFPSNPCNPALPKHPEKTWGKKGSDRHPKKYLERVLRQFNSQPCADTYSEIADKSCVEVIRKRCPISFGKLNDDINDLSL